MANFVGVECDQPPSEKMKGLSFLDLVEVEVKEIPAMLWDLVMDGVCREWKTQVIMQDKKEIHKFEMYVSTSSFGKGVPSSYFLALMYQIVSYLDHGRMVGDSEYRLM